MVSNCLMGNHDLQLMLGDTSKLGSRDLANFKQFNNDPIVGVKKALSSSPYLELIRDFKIMLKIGNVAYFHAGTDRWINNFTPSELNMTALTWVRKQQEYLFNFARGVKLKAPNLPKYFFSYRKNGSMVSHKKTIWGRRISERKLRDKQLQRILNYLGVEKLVFAHTPTASRKIEFRYQGKVALIDTKIGFEHQGGQASALIVHEDGSFTPMNDMKRRRYYIALKNILKRSFNCYELLRAFARK
jgi:hypothetical protein